MPDTNHITVSGMVVSTWTYSDDLYAMLAIYDNKHDGETPETVEVLEVLREQGVAKEQLSRVAAVLDTPDVSPQERQQNAHYATVRFPLGQDPQGHPLTLQHGTRLFVTGYYHEGRGYQNLLGAARRVGIDIDEFPAHVRHVLGRHSFTRPAPYILPEGLTILGHAPSPSDDDGNGGGGDAAHAEDEEA